MRLNHNLKIVQDFLNATDELLEFTKDIKTISLCLMLTYVPEIQ